MVIRKFTIDEFCIHYCICAITNSWKNVANNTLDPAMLRHSQHTDVFNYMVSLKQNSLLLVLLSSRSQ